MEKYDLESWDEDKLGSYGINFIKAKMVEKWFYKNGGIELRERAIQARDIYTKLSILEPNYDEFLAVMRHIAIQEGLTLFQEKVGDVATFNNLDNDEIINYAYDAGQIFDNIMVWQDNSRAKHYLASAIKHAVLFNSIMMENNTLNPSTAKSIRDFSRHVWLAVMGDRL